MNKYVVGEEMKRTAVKFLAHGENPAFVLCEYGISLRRDFGIKAIT